MASKPVLRYISAFNRHTKRWVPVPLSNTWHSQASTAKPSLKPENTNIVRKQRLSLVSWNIDAVSEWPVPRAKCILEHILKVPPPPDVIFLQEVHSAVRVSLLATASVREAFLTTDAEDEVAFDATHFATMALLSRERFPSPEYSTAQTPRALALGSVARVSLPSKRWRDALCVDVVTPAAPHTAVRLINVHLESSEDAAYLLPRQMEEISRILRAPGCSAGVVAGDFNAADDALIRKHGLTDAWIALRGTEDPGGDTWGVGAAQRRRRKPRRLDKIALLGLQAKEIEVLRPGTTEIAQPGKKSTEVVSWSDHCGLRCTITI